MGPVWKLQPGCCGLYVRSAHIPVASLSTCPTGAHLIIPAGAGAKGCAPREGMASPGRPRQRLHGSGVVEWQARNGTPGMADWLSGTGHSHCHAGLDGVWCCCGSPRWAGEGLHGWCIPVPHGQAALGTLSCHKHGLLDLRWASRPLVMPMAVRLRRDPLWYPPRCSPILCQQQRSVCKRIDGEG